MWEVSGCTFDHPPSHILAWALESWPHPYQTLRHSLPCHSQNLSHSAHPPPSGIGLGLISLGSGK